jgi:hypothetical protein
VSNPTFCCSSRDGRLKSYRYSRHVEHCSIIDAPSTHKTTTTTPGFSGARYYPFLVDPPQSCPDQASSAVGQQRNNARTSTTWIARSSQDPGSFTVPSPTSLRHPRDGWHSQMHVATATSTAPTAPSPLRHRLRVLGTPRPPLDSIKERAEGSLDKGQRDR